MAPLKQVVYTLSMTIPDATIAWLQSSGIPHVQLICSDIFGTPAPTRAELLDSRIVRENLHVLKGWGTEALKRHDAATLMIHRLALLADPHRDADAVSLSIFDAMGLLA